MGFNIKTDLLVSGNIIKSGGTSSEVLLSDGSTINLSDINKIEITDNYTTLNAITGMTTGDVVYVMADEINGIFKYDSTQSGVNDFGIIRNGWVRQFKGDILAEWFDTGGDDDLNINYALLAAGDIPVKVNKDITINSAILIDSNQTLDFGTSKIYPSDPMTSTTVVRNRNLSGDTNITIIGGEVIGTNYTGTTYNAVRFENVVNGLVKDMICTDVSIIPAIDSGNLLFTNCSHITVDNVRITGTWRAGVYFSGGSYNSIINSYFNATRDSGIIMVNSDYGRIENNYVDNCGQGSAPIGASNIAANMVNGIFRGNISINASGTTNGNGFTLGHPLGYDAYNSIIEGNFFGFNAAKGLFLQGPDTSGNTISNNICYQNGVGSLGTNSSGIGIAGGSANIISNNTLDGNRYGISIDAGNADNIIQGNVIENSTTAGIRDAGIKTKIQNNYIKNNTGNSFLNEGTTTGSTYVGNSEAIEPNFTIKGNSSSSTNRFTNALLRFKQLNQVADTSVGFSMSTSTTDLYGMHIRTERQTGGTDFRYVISAHKNTEAGVDLFQIDDVGLVSLLQLSITNLPTFADDASASGLTTNTVYKTATGELRIKL